MPTERRVKKLAIDFSHDGNVYLDPTARLRVEDQDRAADAEAPGNVAETDFSFRCFFAEFLQYLLPIDLLMIDLWLSQMPKFELIDAKNVQPCRT